MERGRRSKRCYSSHCGLSSETLSITFVAPFDASFTDDKLGYLGFPKEDGIIQISDYDGCW